MLLKTINNLEKNNRFFFLVGRIVRRPIITIQNCFIEIGSWFRKHGVPDKKYLPLKKYANVYNDERCFILATGPSLNLDDLHLLRNEYSFGMNSIYMVYKDTDWRPTFYGIQDENIYEKLEGSFSSSNGIILVSSNLARKYKSARSFIQFPINSKYNYYDYRYTEKLHVKFSSDSYAEVYDAYSITFSLMQIAIYMGFKEIYLLGADCNQKVGQQNHFIETGHVETSDKLATSADRNIFSHMAFKAYCDKRNIRVFNATRGGALEVYPRVNLEDVLNN